MEATHGAPPRPSSLLLAGALAGAALALYAPTGGFPFISFDDPAYVSQNPTVLAGLSWARVAWAFTTLHYSNWHPLTWLSYLLDATLFGAAPGAMHLVNAALHAANAALVFAALERLTGARWRSAAVAALFALHPTRVESVAWISERKDLLFTFFGLLALLAYAAYARRPSLRGYAWVVLAFAASLMSKAMLVTLPFLLLLLDVWPLRRVATPLVQGLPVEGRVEVPLVSWRRAILEKLPLLALSAGCSALTVLAQAGWKSIVALPLPERLGNALVGYVRYVGLLAWPVDLAVLYPLPQGGHPAWQAAGAALLLVAASACAVLMSRRMPWLALGWFWFVGTLVPVVGLLQVGVQAIADRYTYFPALGLFVALVWGLDALVRGNARRLLALVAGVTLAALAVASGLQLRHWSDQVTLFRHAIAVTGPNARAQALLGMFLVQGGSPGEGLVHARESVRIDPGDERSWMILGLAAKNAGDPVEAEAAMRAALRVDPSYVEAWGRLGTLLREAGRLEEAVTAYKLYLALAPTDGDTWTQVAVLLGSLGRTGEAGAALEAAAGAEPSNPLPWRNLAAFHARHEAWPQAAAALLRATQVAPPDAAVLRQLAVAQTRAGDRAGALATADRLAPLDPAAAAELKAALGPF
jgi:Flp pilus assembly protein TadD